ncbi:MAG: NAD-dependent epimerase/dehydratase family protein [Candidatus Melainabacteria bacterium]|nr:NAD-dependent epimerase/dehydratase family protein [Candidatus Melainabacteria bacterium]
MSEKPIIAITGASGLVGANLSQYLIDRGYKVKALVRDLARAPKGTEAVKADLTDKEAMKNGFAGADIVVHAAGMVDPHGDRQTIFDINLKGTKAALEAANEASVKQFIYISSLSVITGQDDQYDVDESAPLVLCGESYADSKVEAEKYLCTIKDTDTKITCLRPGFIYGPGERAWMPRLITAISNNQVLLIDGGKKETNVIYVDNLSKAIESSFLNEKTYGQVYNLTDGQKVTKKELFDTIADGMNLPRVKKKMPSTIAKPFISLVSSAVQFLPKEQHKNFSRFSRAAYRLAGLNQGFSIKKAERDLNYVERISFKEGMQKTLQTFK